MQAGFFSEVYREVKQPKSKKNNINFSLISQLEKAGAEVKKFIMKDSSVGAIKINPLSKLYEKDFLTRQEYVAGTRYQDNFNLSQKSHHSRPTLIYDGLSHSSASTKSGEGGADQDQLDATFKVEQFKMTLFENDYDCKQNLMKILEYCFEQEMAIYNVEKLLKSDRRTIKDKIKIICKLMLDS